MPIGESVLAPAFGQLYIRDDRAPGQTRSGRHVKWFVAALQKYADFSGRARRMEYWMFMLFSAFCGIALVVVCGLVAGISSNLIGVVLDIYSLALMMPVLAVTVRRLHDTSRSGWWWFLNFVPLVGAIVLLVWMCSDGVSGDDQYGPNPKGLTT